MFLECGGIEVSTSAEIWSIGEQQNRLHKVQMSTLEDIGGTTTLTSHEGNMIV
jgi:hypothetical protein